MTSRAAVTAKRSLAECRYDGLGDNLQRPSRDLARLAQAPEGVVLGETLLLHQQPLRALDRLSRGERVGQRLGFLTQRDQLFVARIRSANGGKHVLLAE